MKRTIPDVHESESADIRRVGVVEQPLEQRRGTGEDGDLLSLDGGQDIVGVVDRHGHVDRAEHQAHEDSGVVTEGVEVRIDE